MPYYPKHAFKPDRTELVLTDADGAPWRLLMSPGTERFIGVYPRVCGIAGDAPLLSFRAVASASF